MVFIIGYFVGREEMELERFVFASARCARALSLSLSGASEASRHGHQIPNSILRFSSSINTRERRGLSRLYPFTPLQFVYLSITSRPVTHFFLFSLFFFLIMIFFFFFHVKDKFNNNSRITIFGSRSICIPFLGVYNYLNLGRFLRISKLG